MTPSPNSLNQADAHTPRGSGHTRRLFYAYARSYHDLWICGVRCEKRIQQNHRLTGGLASGWGIWNCKTQICIMKHDATWSSLMTSSENGRKRETTSIQTYTSLFLRAFDGFSTVNFRTSSFVRPLSTSRGMNRFMMSE